MPRRPIVLVHGYSDKGESFKPWCTRLEAAGYDATTIHLANYVSLSNEISVKDIAEGFDRALREKAGLGAKEPFDAIVHSTGMLVVREWLTTYGARLARLKHLIGLAPATFGSPMAHKGRSWLGAIFKGGKELGPDFLEAGDQVLEALELGSRYTWDLAHRDLLGDLTYGTSASTPYPFIFSGLDDYGWLKRAVTEPGTDGTVRWAGMGFNARKIVVDLTQDPSVRAPRHRIRLEPWKNAHVPLIFMPGMNHGTIISKPSDALVSMVLSALEVESGPAYAAWAKTHEATSRKALQATKAKRYQQFLVRAVDERGDGIDDYFVEIGEIDGNRLRPFRNFDLDVHAFREDESYRAFHVELDKLDLPAIKRLGLRVIASSGTELVSYQGYSSSPELRAGGTDAGKWDATIEFAPEIKDGEFQFFFPYTTTVVELQMNREPMPPTGINRVFWFNAV